MSFPIKKKTFSVCVAKQRRSWRRVFLLFCFVFCFFFALPMFSSSNKKKKEKIKKFPAPFVVSPSHCEAVGPQKKEKNIKKKKERWICRHFVLFFFISYRLGFSFQLYQILPSFTEFLRICSYSCWIVSSFTGFYRVLPSF